MPSYYSHASYLEAAKGNNALSFAERKNAWSACKLFVPKLIRGNRDDVAVGDKVVFEEINKKGELVSCTWLEYLVEIPWDVKIYIMDNHNHAFYFWHKEYISSGISQWIKLLHIDQHADMENPYEAFDRNYRKDISYTLRYTNESCNVGSFIKPAISSWLIGEVVQIRSTAKLEEVSTTIPADPAPYILDIDIDFWVDHFPTAAEKQQIQNLYKHAKLCTVALSPYFIDINQAIKICKELLS